MSQQHTLDVARAVYAAFQQGDVPTVIEHLTEDVSLGFPSMPGVPFYGVRHGKEGAVDFFQALGTHIEFVAFDVKELLAQDDKVVALIALREKVRETGKVVEQPEEVHVLTFAGGRICKARFYHDVAATIEGFSRDFRA